MQTHLPGPADKKSAPETNPTTALKRARNAVTVRAQRSLFALEASGIGTWSWDETCDGVELGSRSKALVGVSETTPNATYQNLFSHLHPDEHPELDGWKHLFSNSKSTQ